MGYQLNHMLRNRCSYGGIHDISEGSQTYDDLMHISIGEVLEDGSNQHDE